MELDLGTWLKKRRRALDLTQEDLAERATCSVNTIRKIESGDLMPSKALAQEIARALDLPSEAHAEFIQFARNPNATASENAFTTTQLVTTPNAPAPEKFRVPAPLGPAIGRDHDTNVVTRILRLPTTRLVTLTGPPGTGKTRLALEIAAALQDEFQHGAAFVELAPIPQANLVESAIAQALDVRTTPQTTLTNALRAFLRDTQLLLVLDNLEHLLDAAPLIGELLRAAPQLKILTTSREALHVYGEREVPVAPLTIPILNPLPTWNALERYAAVQLFVERAQTVNADFELTPANAETIARLCVELDGLPLALEMAAARVKWETPEALLPQLTRRLETLERRARDVETRQQTLRGAMDWSYELLEHAEKRALRQLAIFRGGFTANAAESVIGANAPELLPRLVEKSLVQVEEARGQARYILLETIREYASEKLNAADEAEHAREKHWAFFLALAKTVGTDMLHPPSPDAIAQLHTEESNLRTALDWTISSGRGEYALELAGALVPFWYHSSQMSEGMAWLAQVLNMNLQVNAELAFTRARARNGYAEFLRLVGATAPARELLEQAIMDWRRSGERGRAHLAFALLALSRLALYQGDDELAGKAAHEALEVYQRLGDELGQARSYRRLTEWALNELDYAYASECIERALDLSNAVGNLFERAADFLQRGDIARARGDYVRAQNDYRAAQEVNQIANEVLIETQLLRRLGLVAALRGDLAQAEGILARAIRVASAVKNRVNLAYVFAALALCAALQKRPDAAMHWVGTMDASLEALANVLIVPEVIEYELTQELVRQQASEADIEKWYAEGRLLSPEQAVAKLLTLAEHQIGKPQ